MEKMNQKMDTMMQTIILMEKRLTLVEDQIRIGESRTTNESQTD
jgi:hypothetical protein